MDEPPEKPIVWMGSSRRDLREMPAAVRREMGIALYWAQKGDTHASAKPLSGSQFRGVVEIVSDDDGDTYRAVYTIKLSDAVYVLHVFQKKSKKGISTPRHELDLILKRLQDAKQLHAQRMAARKGSA